MKKLPERSGEAIDRTSDAPTEDFTEIIERLRAELAEAQSEAEQYKRWYREESEKVSENLMYKYAFKALVKEIRG